MVFTIPPPRSMNGIDTRFVARSRCADISNPWSCLYCTKTASIQRVCIHHTFIHGRSWPDRQLHGTLVLAIYKCENKYLLECGDGGSWFSNGTRAPWMTKKCHRALCWFFFLAVWALSWVGWTLFLQNKTDRWRKVSRPRSSKRLSVVDFNYSRVEVTVSCLFFSVQKQLNCTICFLFCFPSIIYIHTKLLGDTRRSEKVPQAKEAAVSPLQQYDI